MTPIALKWMSTKDVCDAQIAALTGLLSSSEQARAARFRGAGDRKTYVAAHALLRGMLSKHLDRGGADLVFATGAHGKPALPGSDLQFNLSHTTDLVLVGLCRGLEIGVDVEWLGRDAPLEIAPRVLTRAEQTWLAACPPDQRPEAFLRFWTLKEAIMKATGQGLALGADSFEVSQRPPAVLSQALAHKWQLHDVSVPVGYVAALAVAAPADIKIDVARACVSELMQARLSPE